MTVGRRAMDDLFEVLLEDRVPARPGTTPMTNVAAVREPTPTVPERMTGPADTLPLGSSTPTAWDPHQPAEAMQLDWADTDPGGWTKPAHRGGYRTNARPEAKAAPPATRQRLVWAWCRGVFRRLEARQKRRAAKAFSARVFKLAFDPGISTAEFFARMRRYQEGDASRPWPRSLPMGPVTVHE